MRVRGSKYGVEFYLVANLVCNLSWVVKSQFDPKSKTGKFSPDIAVTFLFEWAGCEAAWRARLQRDHALDISGNYSGRRSAIRDGSFPNPLPSGYPPQPGRRSAGEEWVSAPHWRSLRAL